LHSEELTVVEHKLHAAVLFHWPHRALHFLRSFGDFDRLVIKCGSPKHARLTVDIQLRKTCDGFRLRYVNAIVSRLGFRGAWRKTSLQKKPCHRFKVTVAITIL